MMITGADDDHDQGATSAAEPAADGFAFTMNPDYLDFEQPIADLEVKINELRLVGADNRLNISDEIAKLQDKSLKLTEKIFGALTPWQISQLARHPLRPYTEDYLRYVFTDFDELHGDRYFADDPALIGGIAYLDRTPVMVIGHQKGRSTSEKVKRNFGMPKPEGYRKARRLMLLAERYKMPVLTLIDTPGAYPGVDSEARGINEAIAENLAVMSRLRTPIIATVTGEGNSGGAIAIGVCDHLNMLQYSTYFVISPEGCATILWKSAEHKALAAEAMGVTSARLEELGIVDQTIPEPLGGAHRDMKGMAATLKEQLIEQVMRLQAMDLADLVERRYRRLMSHGASRG
jgi:acetyl-CoA carboxylase carboxyl transferase subunit alpha